MSEIIIDPRQVDLEEAIAAAKPARVYGMAEAERQIGVAKLIYQKMTGEPMHHWDRLSLSEKRPYIDLACIREN